jgi:hypothetical protein
VTDRPHWNEAVFYRYPMQRLVAVMDTRSGVDDALERIRRLGVDLSGVHVLSGTDGAALLDRSGRRHGVRGRLTRLLQRTSAEDDTLDLHHQALEGGGHVVYVPARGEDAKARVAAALRAAGGHNLVYFGRFTTEKTWI